MEVTENDKHSSLLQYWISDDPQKALYLKLLVEIERKKNIFKLHYPNPQILDLGGRDWKWQTL